MALPTTRPVPPPAAVSTAARRARRAVPAACAAIALAATLGLTPGLAAALTTYTVEVIVFEELSGAGLREESWPEDPGMPDIASAEMPGGPGGFTRVPRGQLQLRETWNRLRRSREFRPLLHAAWRQPGYSKARARSAQVRTDADTVGEVSLGGPRVEGTIRLHRSRYLHVEADLLYRRAEAANAGLPGAFRLTATRRMRSREMHYLDHPLFGVLVLVTPHARSAPRAPAAAPEPATGAQPDGGGG